MNMRELICFLSLLAAGSFALAESGAEPNQTGDENAPKVSAGITELNRILDENFSKVAACIEKTSRAANIHEATDAQKLTGQALKSLNQELSHWGTRNFQVMGQVHLKIHNNFPDSNSSDEAKQWFAILNRVQYLRERLEGPRTSLNNLILTLRIRAFPVRPAGSRASCLGCSGDRFRAWSSRNEPTNL
jgi:hypothetical protein